MIRCRAVLCAIALLANVSAGQDTFPTDPRLAIEVVRDAYRAAPVTERMTVKVEIPGGRMRTATAALSLALVADPSDPANQPRPILRLELGDLIASIDGTRLVAANSRDPSTIFITDLPAEPTPETLEAIFPFVPAPQAAIALGPRPGTHLCAYAPDVTWASVEIPDGPRRALVPPTIHGHSRFGPVRLLVDPRTGRMQEFVARIQSDRYDMTITIAVVSTPVPDPPRTWLIDERNTVRVTRFADLTRERTPVRVGDPPPLMRADSADGARTWRLNEDAIAGPLAILMADLSGADEAGPELMHTVTTVSAALNELDPPIPVQRIAIAPVAARVSLPDADQWLSTPTRRSTLDCFTTDGLTRLVIIRDRAVIAVIDPLPLDQAALADLIHKALAQP